MSRTCDICGKHPMTGNKVSHAKNRTRRVWRPNLLKIKTVKDGSTVTLKICTRCLRSGRVVKKV
jgi:large subunit ribosomal protein L28